MPLRFRPTEQDGVTVERDRLCAGEIISFFGLDGCWVELCDGSRAFQRDDDLCWPRSEGDPTKSR